MAMSGATRDRRLRELRAAALDEGLDLVLRVQAEVERMQLVDEILEERLRESQAGANTERQTW